jgi:hypothetical protein
MLNQQTLLFKRRQEADKHQTKHTPWIDFLGEGS